MGSHARLATTLLSFLALTTTLSGPETLADPPRQSSTYGTATGQSSGGTGGYSTRATAGPKTSSRVAPPPSAKAPGTRPNRTSQPAPRQHGDQYGDQHGDQSHQSGYQKTTPYVVYVPTTPYAPPPYAVAPYSVAPPSTHTVLDLPTGPAAPAPPTDAPPTDAPPTDAPPTETVTQQVYIVSPSPSTPATPDRPAPTHQPPTPAPPTPPEGPREPAAIEYRITPPEAMVYLNGELLGSGDDLMTPGELRELKPGVHVLRVTHPDHRPQRVVFDTSSGEPLFVAVDLTAERTAQRSRVR